MKDNLQIVKPLGESGANLNATDKDGDTPLYNTVYGQKRFEVAKFPIENGSDVNASDYDGQTTLHLAIWTSSSSVKGQMQTP